MQYGQSGKKINKQEYYCTRCKRKLPYKICPLHGMEPVIMLDAASQPSGMGAPGSNGSTPNKGGKSPRPLPSGTGFEQPVKQPPVTTPPPAARPAPPKPQPQTPAARPAPPARPTPPRQPATPAPPARPAPAPVAARPAPPVTPPARPAPPRQPAARPQARAVTITPPRPAQPAPPKPQPPARPAPPRQQPPVQQTIQQPVAPPRSAPPKPQPPKPQPKPQSSNDGDLFFEIEESAGNLFEFDDTPASSLENLIEQNLHTQKPPRNPLEESTQESTAMDMGFDNESLSFDPPSTGFRQESTPVSFDPMAADPGIHRPAGNGYHDPEPVMSSNSGPVRDASPSRANVKRPKKRRSQAKARRTGLPISAKLALITLVPTVLVAAAVYLSFDKISEVSDSLMARINGQQTQQTANIPPAMPQEITEEPRNVAVSQTEETPVEETTSALSSGGSLSDRDSIEDLMVSAHQSYDKQQYLRPVNNNAILYISKVLELQEDHRPAIEMKSKIIEYYNDKAAIAIESSKYDLAIRNYENILQITPNDAITKRLLGQAQNLRRSSRKLQNMKALQKTQDEVKRLQKEKYKLKTQVKAERRKLEQINQAGGN